MYILSILIFGWYLHVITWHHIGVGLPTRFTVEFCDSGSPRQSMWSLGVMVCCQRGKHAATAAFLEKACVRGRSNCDGAWKKDTNAPGFPMFSCQRTRLDRSWWCICDPFPEWMGRAVLWHTSRGRLAAPAHRAKDGVQHIGAEGIGGTGWSWQGIDSTQPPEMGWEPWNMMEYDGLWCLMIIMIVQWRVFLVWKVDTITAIECLSSH